MSKDEAKTRINTQIERLARIVDFLLEGRHTAGQLAEALGVTDRQIRRDVSLLQKQNYPIYSDREGYGLERFPFRLSYLTAEERQALLRTTLLMRQVGLPGITAFEAVLQKATSPIGGRSYHDTVKFFLNPEGTSAKVGHRMAELDRAILHHRVVKMTYHVASRDETTEREVNPYGVFFEQGEWQLVAYCHLRKAVRHFKLAQMKKIQVLTRSFPKPDDFDLDQHLASFWKIQTDRPPVEVTLRFTPEGARRVDTIHKLHVSQQETWQEDGSLLLQFTLRDPESLLPWIFGWGEMVEIVGPKDLKAAFIERCRALSVPASR